MIRLDDFSGRLTDAEVARAEEFIHAVDAAKGANDRRVVYSGDVTTSRIRAKLAEVFVSALLDTPLDLSIYNGNDRGIDTIYKGYWIQVKRGGTRKAIRGKGWFRLELNDPHAVDPPWDLGFLVEDDPDDARLFRLSSWTTREHWMRSKQVVDGPPRACWAVTSVAAPELLFRMSARNPPRSWPLPTQ